MKGTGFGGMNPQVQEYRTKGEGARRNTHWTGASEWWQAQISAASVPEVALFMFGQVARKLAVRATSRPP